MTCADVFVGAHREVEDVVSVSSSTKETIRIRGKWPSRGRNKSDKPFSSVLIEVNNCKRDATLCTD